MTSPSPFPVRVCSVSTWLPAEGETASQALALGLTTEKDREDSGYESLPVSAETSAPDMAALAARSALEQSSTHPSDVGFLAHAWTYYQGHDFWSPAHYVADQVGARSALPVGVQQMCNGGAAGLTLAAWSLAHQAGGSHALVTTADRFARPGFDRWAGDYGLVYGDGATAALLSRTASPDDSFELLSLSSAASPSMEDMHRGDDPSGEAPHLLSPVVDARRTKKAFLRRHGGDHFPKETNVQVPRVIHDCLAAAEISPDDPRIRLVALPRLGHKALITYREAVGRALSCPALDFGSRTGHLGAGDLIANMAVLAEQNLLGGDEIALVLSAGAGFTWSCAALRRIA